jgi:hypothetical protein
MPPAYVKPYVKRQKNDATDAEAILRGGYQSQHAVRADQDGSSIVLDVGPVVFTTGGPRQLSGG